MCDPHNSFCFPPHSGSPDVGFPLSHLAENQLRSLGVFIRLSLKDTVEMSQTQIDPG